MYIMLQRKTGKINNINEGFNNTFKSLIKTRISKYLDVYRNTSDIEFNNDY